MFGKIFFVMDKEYGTFQLYCDDELVNDTSFCIDDPAVYELVQNLNEFGGIPVYTKITLESKNIC